MNIPINSTAKILSTKPVCINSVSIYNPNDTHAYVELYDQVGNIETSTPYRTIEAPPQCRLSIKEDSNLVLSFTSGLTAIGVGLLPEDLILQFN